MRQTLDVSGDGSERCVCILILQVVASSRNHLPKWNFILLSIAFYFYLICEWS